jgi:hypothetical protein
MEAREGRGEVLRRLGKWAFALVPAVGLLELALHFAQVKNVTPPEDWDAAREAVRSLAQPDDLIAFAPKWVDPIGREKFGPELMTFERVGRSDEARFPRALELSIRGGRLPELEDWPLAEEKHFGAVTLRVLKNPSPQKVMDDLVTHARFPNAEVSRADGSKCAWTEGPTRSGPWFESYMPGRRFACSDGSYIGEGVLPALDYSPRRCLMVAVPGGNAPVTAKFLGVVPGHRLVGHHAVAVHQERDRKGAPVTLVWRAGDRMLGKVVHRDGDGWKPFELDLSDLAGRGPMEISVEVSSPDRRAYCFEASTRD